MFSLHPVSAGSLTDGRAASAAAVRHLDKDPSEPYDDLSRKFPRGRKLHRAARVFRDKLVVRGGAWDARPATLWHVVRHVRVRCQ